MAQRILILPLFLVFLLSSTAFAQQTRIPFLIGTYTQGHFHGKGIYLSELDTATGALNPAELAIPCDAPAFLVKGAANNVIYAVGETWSPDQGPVYAFSYDPKTKQLSKLDEVILPGTGPTHLCVHSGKEGDSLIVACYGGGSVISISLEKDGRFGEVASGIPHAGSGPNPNRQKEPHPHGAYVVPGTAQILVPDLGTDRIMMYDLDPATSKLTPSEPPFLATPAGSGPRHLDFDPTDPGRFYVVNELDSTVCLVRKNAEGRWKIGQTVSTLPKELLDDKERLAKLGNSTAEIAVHPSGKFVYASNRGLDGIAVYAVEKQTGQLTLIQSESTRGRAPRHFAISPEGKFLLAENQDSDTIQAFRIDADSGKITPTGEPLSVGSPVCILWME